ncbi:MAG: TatD family hydrolase [Bacteroidales bacterium]|nr:TatD family hydrolase [Candidatus Physcousia equi]
MNTTIFDNLSNSLFDLHAHHPSRQGERVVEQDVDSLGVHPWHAADADVEEVMNKLCIRLQNDENHRIAAIGECGLDKLCTVPFPQQMTIFRRHIAWSLRFRLPLIIHCVRAWNELLALRQEYALPSGDVPWIVHGFRGKPELMQQLLRAGFFVSFGFRHNINALRQCPPERCYFETDTDPRSVTDLHRLIAYELEEKAEDVN